MPYLPNKKRPNDAYLRPLLGPNEEGGGTMRVLCSNPMCNHWIAVEDDGAILMKWRDKNLTFCDMKCAMEVFNTDVDQ
jgi:hypothetical protein